MAVLSTFRSLFCIIQYFSEASDRRGQIDIIYSIATGFDELNHDLLLLYHSVGFSISNSKDINLKTFGKHQKSGLGLLLVIIFINVMIFKMHEFCCRLIICNIILRLQESTNYYFTFKLLMI